MSIEKLRADIEGVERVQEGMTFPLGFRNFLPVLRALLDEHEETRENDGASWEPDSYSAFREAEELIERYGESE